MKRPLLVLGLVAIFALRMAPAPSRTWRLPVLFTGTALEASYIPTPIKSVQQVSISIGAAASATGTITSITPTAALLISQGNDASDAGGFINGDSWAYGAITNATTVTASKNVSSGTTVWNGVVAEFLASFVKSQGCGTVAIADGSTSNTATIPSVNTAKTVVASTGQTNSYATSSAIGDSQVLGKVTLTNGTTITASRQGFASAGVSLVEGYCYLEFK